MKILATILSNYANEFTDLKNQMGWVLVAITVWIKQLDISDALTDTLTFCSILFVLVRVVKTIIEVKEKLKKK